MGKSCTIDLRVAGSSPAGQLLIYFHNVFPVLTKILCGHSSLVPRSRIKDFVPKPQRCSRRPLAPLPGDSHIFRGCDNVTNSIFQFQTTLLVNQALHNKN